MKRFLVILFLLCFFPVMSEATVVFSSKWDSATNGGAGTENDGGNWHQAEPGQAGVSILRVSGDQSVIGNGGPSGVPAGSGATYYLRIRKTNADDNMLYLQNVDESSGTEYSDLYMGAWWYFETGFDFRDSVKFMDFRGNLSKLAVGNGHLQLFGFNHNGYYAANTTYGTGGYTNYGTLGSAPLDYQYITTFRYLAGAGQNVSGNEGNLNFYNVSPTFDSNLNTSEVVQTRSGYNPANVNRVQIAGGKWIAVIIHAKIHTTDGELDMWIKDGASDLKKVMEWNRNTVWSSDNSTPHDFYTANGTANINHVQFCSYWNSGTSYPATQYIWLSNPVVATTLAEVKTYMGLDGGDTTPPVVTISTSDPSNITSNSLSISGTASDAVGVTSCKYRIGSAPDGSNGTVITGTTSWSGTATGFAEGANTLYVGCTDAAANWGSDSITVNYTIIPAKVQGVTITGVQIK